METEANPDLKFSFFCSDAFQIQKKILESLTLNLQHFWSQVIKGLLAKSLKQGQGNI